jgi:hypothetical protein
MRKTLPYDWVWHHLVKVATLLNDSFMCGGMENADLSIEVWPRTTDILLSRIKMLHELIPHDKINNLGS